jgi:hypothetical protein
MRPGRRDLHMLAGKRNLLVVLAIITTMAIGGASAVLANNNSGNVIYACVNNNSGEVKIVAADTVCRENSTLVHWNQEGTPGMDGDDGSDGVDGTDGVDGVDGTDGTDGENGDPGPASGAASQVVAGNASAALSTAVCPSGTFATGGGFSMTADSSPFASFPSTTSAAIPPVGVPAPAWSVVKNPSDGVLVTAFAVCAP